MRKALWQGCSPRPAPRKNGLPRPAPRKAGLAPPRPAPPRKIDEIRGAQRGKKGLQIPLIPLSIMPANDALKEERVGKSFHFSFFTFCDCLSHKNTF